MADRPVDDDRQSHGGHQRQHCQCRLAAHAGNSWRLRGGDCLGPDRFYSIQRTHHAYRSHAEFPVRAQAVPYLFLAVLFLISIPLVFFIKDARLSSFEEDS